MSKGTSSMLGDVELIVTPEQMYCSANLIEKNIQSARTAFDSMLNDIKSTSSFWEGSAADKERMRFENESDNFASLINNLTNYVTELKLITNIYEVGEQVSAADSQTLNSNVLS